ncbi:MAG: cysteine desulfurase family protein [Patescibacteria group bacterium]
MKETYLDNAATTPCDKQVLKEMEPYCGKIYGNPSSFNEAGRKARKAIEEARKKIVGIIGAKKQELTFTSSVSESNNLAILGLIRALNKTKKSHIITTRIEHPSVLNTIKSLEKEGVKITYLPVNKEGLINLDEFQKFIKPETILVSIIYANNEIGSIQPIKKIAKIIKEIRNSGLTYPYLHIDAAQAGAHLDMKVNNLGVDLMSISSHKIYGPKGIAALYIRQGIKVEPLIHGGNQEWGLRSSTEPTPLIAGFAKAFDLADAEKKKNLEKQEGLRNYFISELRKNFPSLKINGPENPRDRVPHIISAAFEGIENEQLLLQLDKAGIHASAGSACTSRQIEPSHVLKAIGLKDSEARSTIRISLGKQTTLDELKYVLKILPKVVKNIKKLYPEELKKHYYGRVD